MSTLERAKVRGDHELVFEALGSDGRELEGVHQHARGHAHAHLAPGTYAENVSEFIRLVFERLSHCWFVVAAQMLEFRIKYAKQVFEESQKLQPLIQNGPKYDTIMGQLDSFVTRLTGDNGASATAAASGNSQAVRSQTSPAQTNDSILDTYRSTVTLLTTGDCSERARCPSPELFVRELCRRSTTRDPAR